MLNYNDKVDYCGPEGLRISKFIPRKIAGVDINWCCYVHDRDWRDEKETADDKRFRTCIQSQFDQRGKHKTGVVVSWLFFLGVRVGRFGAVVKGWL